jgi:hypothetical protein
VVGHSKIRRPNSESYHGGYEAEGYAQETLPAVTAEG